MALQDLIDIECFEVLRGPQGALFGRNSKVGALNITTNRPSFTPSESFEASFGNDSFVQAKAILTGPINDKVAYQQATIDLLAPEMGHLKFDASSLFDFRFENIAADAAAKGTAGGAATARDASVSASGQAARS